MLFVSGPNWGVQTNSDWGAWIICPAENQTNDNGTLQGYQEFLGGPTFSALQNIQQTFTYDGVNRLKTAQEGTNSWNRTYTYDQWGNMTPSTSNSVIPLAANSPTGFNSATNQISTPGIFSYDNGGNLTALNGNTLAYDAEKRLKSVSGLGVSETISYDATGRRVQKSLSSGSTAYVYDAFGNLSAEYANGTTWSRDYIRWAGGQLIATENASGPCTTCYFSYDHLGSVRLVTDANANIIARHDYLPYGEEIAAGVGGRNSQFGLTTDTTAKFTGQLRDQEAGQDYFNARYFAAVLGRFNSPDPGSAGANLSNSQSWNGYSYTRGNPLNATDPSGLVACLSRGAPSARSAPSGGCGGYYESTGGYFGGSGVVIDGGTPIPPGLFGSGSNGAGGDSAVQCPNNLCEASNGVGLPTEFVATASGAAYYSCMLPGLWDSQTQAGIAASTCGSPVSNALKLETGGVLYATDNGQYSFTFTMGGRSWVLLDPGMTPDGDSFAGYYHTHPPLGFPYQTEVFSSQQVAGDPPADLQTMSSPQRNPGLPPGYLGTPSGNILMFDPSQSAQNPTGCVLVGKEVWLYGMYVPMCP